MILLNIDFNNLYILIPLIVVLIIALVSIILFVSRKVYFSKRKQNNSLFALALGSKENIISIECHVSRLNLVLKDYSLVDETRLKELGVSSILKMSNKLTLVIGKEAKEIYELLK